MASDEMTPEEIAAYFKQVANSKEPVAIVASETYKKIEALADEEQQNSTKIYAIAARIKNLARINGHLTDQGHALCNSFVHIIKSYYNFADTLTNPEEKQRLIDITRKNEEIPANLIASLAKSVTMNAKGKKK